jgi:hypothetical protein
MIKQSSIGFTLYNQQEKRGPCTYLGKKSNICWAYNGMGRLDTFCAFYLEKFQMSNISFLKKYEIIYLKNFETKKSREMLGVLKLLQREFY